MDAIRRLLAEATWRDTIVAFIDILIVYYAIYRVLLLIKGTRAAQMVIGLVLIGAGFFAAEQFELATVSWLLDNFINYFIIIIIVVFQHDIRRGLVRMGQNLFSFGRTYEETHVFEEVIHAAEHLAKARMGALIVFEREADVTDLVDTGQIIDARVSRDMLVSLFVPSRENMLHDGAVIIKALRIQQAGAVLPLSANPRLDKELGTRHRAAIGVTEETDAVAVVVSEERGEISLCFGGRIARDLDAATLRKALVGLFYKDKRKKQDVAEEAQAAAAAAEALAALSSSPEDKPAEPGPPASDLRGDSARAATAAGAQRHPRPETRRIVRAPTAPVAVVPMAVIEPPPPGPPVEGAVTDEQAPPGPPAGAPEAG